MSTHVVKPVDITRITLGRRFAVNCYLLKTGSGYVLIDTGMPRQRGALESGLRGAGCEPGKLRLVVLTHAHTDHAGSCAYLQKEWQAPVGMHDADGGKAAQGDMFWSADGLGLSARVARTLGLLAGLARFEAFVPDVLLHDGQDLRDYGLDASVLHLPGHSPGSLGILCADGPFFCGDLLTNIRRPAKNTLIDDETRFGESIARLETLRIETVHPGHGASFPASALR